MIKPRKFYQWLMAAAAAAAFSANAAAPQVSAASSFTDVNDHYAEAVHYVSVHAGAKGITKSQFGTDESIKRADAAILLANLLKLDTESAPDSLLRMFQNAPREL